MKKRPGMRLIEVNGKTFGWIYSSHVVSFYGEDDYLIERTPISKIVGYDPHTEQENRVFSLRPSAIRAYIENYLT